MHIDYIKTLSHPAWMVVLQVAVSISALRPLLPPTHNSARDHQSTTGIFRTDLSVQNILQLGIVIL